MTPLSTDFKEVETDIQQCQIIVRTTLIVYSMKILVQQTNSVSEFFIVPKDFWIK